MKLFKIKENLLINPEQIVSVNMLSDTDNFCLVTLSNMSGIPNGELRIEKTVLQKMVDECGDTPASKIDKTDLRKLTEAMDRLRMNFPHSIRIHP